MCYGTQNITKQLDILRQELQNYLIIKYNYQCFLNIIGPNKCCIINLVFYNYLRVKRDTLPLCTRLVNLVQLARA